MTEKMTYEKLFRALKEGKRVCSTLFPSSFYFKLCKEKSIIVNQDNKDAMGAFAARMLDSNIEQFEIIEEEKPYDMTYREALMYMLEKPGVHCVSQENRRDIICVNKDTLAFYNIKGRDEWGLDCVINFDEKWRKESDLDYSGTETDVATKKNINTCKHLDCVFDSLRYWCGYEQSKKYKKGDKLLTPAEVFKALLAGEKVTNTVWNKEQYLLMRDGLINRTKYSVSYDINSEFCYESDEEYWWEIAE